VRPFALVDHGGFPVLPAINWLHSSQRSPAEHDIVSWLPSTSIWSCSHLIGWGLLFLLLAVLSAVLKCESRVVCSVAAITVTRETHWCLHYCWITAGGALGKAPVVWPDSDPISPGWGVYGAMTCCCGKMRKMRKMITKRSGKSWGICRYLQVIMEWVTANLHILFKMHPAAYSCRLQGIPMVLQFAVSLSDVVCLFTGIHCSEWQLQSHVW